MWWRALVGESAGGAAQSVAQVAESWLPGAGVGPREVGSAGAPAGGLSVEWIVWRIGFSSFWSGYRVRYELGSGDAMSGRGRRVQAVLAWAECDAKFFPREAAGRLETRSMEGEEARDKRGEVPSIHGRARGVKFLVTGEWMTADLVYSLVKLYDWHPAYGLAGISTEFIWIVTGVVLCLSVVEEVGEVAVRDIRVVQEREDVFRSLRGLPSSRSESRTIELEPGTTPLSKAPYMMAPAELEESVMLVMRNCGSFRLCFDYRGEFLWIQLRCNQAEILPRPKNETKCSSSRVGRGTVGVSGGGSGGFIEQDPSSSGEGSGTILVHGRVCVPKDEDLRQEILREAHA
ncbi:hypothetical protein AALP_AAs58272U000100, partial [Arabis alpina]